MFVLGVFCVFGVQKAWQDSVICSTHFDLLNPDSTCAYGEVESSEWDYEPLRQNLIQKVADYNASGNIPHVALYFRDLKYGSRFAIRENENFEPASLLKIPIMMVLLHEADHNPEFLNERLLYEKEDSYRFITGPIENILELGSSYSIRELLEKMIRYSDNSSTTLLLKRIEELGLGENSNTFADLGTMQLLMGGELDNTRLISLVNIFVALYNANYLTPHSSQFALELLTTTNFDSAIVGGIPGGTRVAHKYGMRVGSTVKENELHDCGIVYHHSNPYVLCVLTAGADFDTASAAIRNISKFIYESVDSLNP